MQIDVADMAKIATAFGSAGGAFAFARPFAKRLFDSWLTRAEQREQDERDRANAIVRIAASNERMVGVMESLDARMDRTDTRLDRIEAHLGISLTPSAIPSPVPPASPRRHLTDPAIVALSPPPATSSGGSGGRVG